MSLQSAELETLISPFSRSISMDRACQILGVSRRTVYYWIKEGRLQTMRTQLGSQRVLTDSLKSVCNTRS
jgi:excisionase family DNA binding protein